MELLPGPDIRLRALNVILLLQPRAEKQLHRPGGPRRPQPNARRTPRRIAELVVLLGGDLRDFKTTPEHTSGRCRAGPEEARKPGTGNFWTD